ncbi:hypothetical protein [Vibrio sp. JPW-9-11-11]|uniref:hypothetical protein n=1 Tax=Vibrio sp. JPW-9-11-11 TaxID=1416532 RepID=UPI001594DEDF|nr:hypothetical protein [Vibrio sp. JPW-9-11-11]
MATATAACIAISQRDGLYEKGFITETSIVSMLSVLHITTQEEYGYAKTAD